MEDRKPAPAKHKIRLLRNWFADGGIKKMKGDIVEVARDQAQAMLTSGIGEKPDARTID